MKKPDKIEKKYITSYPRGKQTGQKQQQKSKMKKIDRQDELDKHNIAKYFLFLFHTESSSSSASIQQRPYIAKRNTCVALRPLPPRNIALVSFIGKENFFGIVCLFHFTAYPSIIFASK